MLTIKFIILAIITVATGGLIFPEPLRKYRVLVIMVGCISVLSTVYLFRDVYHDLKEDVKEEINVEAAPYTKIPETDFLNIIHSLTQAEYIDWNNIERIMPFVVFPIDPKKNNTYPFQSCLNEDLHGKTKIFFQGKPVMNIKQNSVVTWDVYTCGPNVGVRDITFRSDHFYPAQTKDIYSSIKNSLVKDGFNIKYVGCNGNHPFGWSYYLVKKDGMRPFSLSIYGGQSSTVNYTMIKISFSEKDFEMNTKGCNGPIDRLSIKN